MEFVRIPTCVVYLGMDQLLFRRSRDDDDDRGLGAFAQHCWAPADRNDVPHYVGGGLVYKGLFRNRDGQECPSYNLVMLLRHGI